VLGKEGTRRPRLSAQPQVMSVLVENGGILAHEKRNRLRKNRRVIATTVGEKKCTGSVGQ